MSEYREKRTISRDAPVGRRVETQYAETQYPETQYAPVVNEPRGMSGLAVAALVVAAIAAALVITMLIISSQQRNTDQQLAEERARSADAQPPVPAAQQPPIIVAVPQAQPATAPVPPPTDTAQTAALSSVDLEKDVASKLLDDQELRSYSVDVKVSGGTATLSGHLPYEDLKTRAERLAMTVKGIHSIVNNITVQS
jgi:hypothetical protein